MSEPTEETMSEAYAREAERHMLAAVYGGYSLCREFERGDGVCEICRVSLDECEICHGIAYHRFDCPEVDSGG